MAGGRRFLMLGRFAAVRARCGGNNCFLLRFGNQALDAKLLTDADDRRNIVPVVTPGTVARRQLGDAAAFGIDYRACWRAWALIQRIRDAVIVHVGFAQKRETGVEGAAGDVAADAQPIRSEVIV